MTHGNPCCRELAAVLLGAVLVVGCADKTTTADRTEVQIPGQYPRALLVHVTDEGDPGVLADEDVSAADTAAGIGGSLADAVVTRLRRQDVPADRLQLGVVPADALLLDLRVTRLERGSPWKRMVIGFGLGRSRLGVLATLRRAVAGPPVLEFQVDAGSGRQPGAVGAVAGLAAGPALLAAAQGGASAWKANGTGTVKDTNEAAGAILNRLDQYFRAAGWRNWTAAPRSLLGMAQPASDSSGTSLPPPRR